MGHAHRIHLGIDLGGTKIEIIALNETGRELIRRRIPTPQADYGAILRAITDLVKGVEATLGQQGTVGIGTPGALSKGANVVKNSNTVCLIGQPLPEDLERMLQRPVRMANDANCFTLSEASDGAGAGADVVFGVILGTGVGGGIVVCGKVVTGQNDIAGEWGHNPLPWPDDEERPGPDCYCGKKGCIETFLSGPGLKADHFRTTGERLEPETIAARAGSGDMSCEDAMMRYERRLARSLAHIINILDPNVIILGGGLSNVARLYENVPRFWQSYVFSDRVDTPLLRAVHGDSSGVRGAAWLWAEQSH